MPYTHLLVPSDGSEMSSRAVTQAVQLARAVGARLTFLHVQAHAPIPLIGMGEMLDVKTMELLIAANRKESDAILEQAMAAATEAGVSASCERVPGDLPHRGILEAAERLGSDLIVMASHGRRGLSGLLLGSETQRVLVQAPCPVLDTR